MWFRRALALLALLATEPGISTVLADARSWLCILLVSQAPANLQPILGDTFGYLTTRSQARVANFSSLDRRFIVYEVIEDALRVYLFCIVSGLRR